MDNETLEVLKNCPSSEANFNYFGAFFPLVYGIPTIILTMMLINTILTHNHLQHVFFYQFIVFGTGNSFYWLSSLLMDKILILPILCPTFVQWFSNPNVFLKGLFLVYCYAIENYFFSAFAIYAWRVVSFVHRSPTKPKQKHLGVMLFVQFIVPFSMFWLFINTDVYYSFLQPGTSKIWFLSTGWPYISASAASGVMFGFLSVVIVFSSTIMIYRIFRIKEFVDNRAERNIIFTCLTFSVAAAAISLYQCCISIVPNKEALNQLLSLRGYVIDVASLLPTWCLLLTSSDVRQTIFKTKTEVRNMRSSRASGAAMAF